MLVFVFESNNAVKPVQEDLVRWNNLDVERFALRASSEGLNIVLPLANLASLDFGEFLLILGNRADI